MPSKNNKDVTPLSQNNHKITKATKEFCVETLRKIALANPDKVITRNYFRVNSNLAESAWNKHFGTFHEFKRQSGIVLSRHAHQLERHIAKHASVDNLREMTKEKQSWGEAYNKPSGKRFQTILVGSDIHDIECDAFWRELFIDTAKRVKPERIVLNGDILDLPEFGKYSVDPREWDVVGRIKWVHTFLEDLREASPDSQIDFIEGNHECVSADTLILTENGWKRADHIGFSDKVAQVDLKTKTLHYAAPIALAKSTQELVSIKGNLHDEVVSRSHSVIIDGERVKVESLIGSSISQDKFMYSFDNNNTGIDLSDDYIRLLTWVVADATIVKRQISNTRIQWKLSREDKIKSLSSLLNKMGIEFTYRKAVMSGVNKLQPYYICIYGDEARKIHSILQGQKTYPSNWRAMNKDQVSVLLETLLITDGSVSHNHSKVTSSKEQELELLQEIFVSNGIPAKLSSKVNTGFSKKPVYVLDVYNNGVYDRNYVEVTDLEQEGIVVSIQTDKQTLVTKRNGKVVVTGNCRLLRHLSEATPALKAVLGDLHGWTVADLLGIKKYEVNYVAPADLSTFTKAEETKELHRNFLVIDNFLVAHHFPEGFNFGLAGWNGHHHLHLTRQGYNPINGPYEWHQLGSGHRRHASYCNGEKWSTGFLLVHTDTVEKRAQFEYIDCTSNHCVIGGKWYQRGTK